MALSRRGRQAVGWQEAVSSGEDGLEIAAGSDLQEAMAACCCFGFQSPVQDRWLASSGKVRRRGWIGFDRAKQFLLQCEFLPHARHLTAGLEAALSTPGSDESSNTGVEHVGQA